MTTYRRNYASERAGFTLVEILVVIVIIGLLAGMTTTVVVSARRSVNASVVSSQEAQLSIALDEYKNRFGEYPPDFSDKEAVVRHVKKRWPRFDIGTGSTDELYSNFVKAVGYGCRLSSAGYKRGGSLTVPASVDDLPRRHIWNLVNYASSLVFWLGGLPDEYGIPSGFYASPKYPLGVNLKTNEPIRRPERAKREKPVYLFDRKTVGALGIVNVGGSTVYYVDDNVLKSSSDVKEYVPTFLQGSLPVLYFRPSYWNKGFMFADSDSAEVLSCAVPYARTGTKGEDGSYSSFEWYEENRFQLVHPGVDGLFGDAVVAPRVLQPKNGAVIGADDDNVTNFIDSGTLVSEYETAN